MKRVLGTCNHRTRTAVKQTTALTDGITGTGRHVQTASRIRKEQVFSKRLFKSMAGNLFLWPMGKVVKCLLLSNVPSKKNDGDLTALLPKRSCPRSFLDLV